MNQETKKVSIPAAEIINAAREKNPPVFWGQLSVIRLLKGVPFEVAGVERGKFDYFVYQDQVSGKEITSSVPASSDEVLRWEGALTVQTKKK